MEVVKGMQQTNPRVCRNTVARTTVAFPETDTGKVNRGSFDETHDSFDHVLDSFDFHH
jgi:hypothetical protein